jgi:hypothetical protein
MYISNKTKIKLPKVFRISNFGHLFLSIFENTGIYCKKRLKKIALLPYQSQWFNIIVFFVTEKIIYTMTVCLKLLLKIVNYPTISRTKNVYVPTFINQPKTVIKNDYM